MTSSLLQKTRENECWGSDCSLLFALKIISSEHNTCTGKSCRHFKNSSQHEMSSLSHSCVKKKKWELSSRSLNTSSQINFPLLLLLLLLLLALILPSVLLTHSITSLFSPTSSSSSISLLSSHLALHFLFHFPRVLSSCYSFILWEAAEIFCFLAMDLSLPFLS